jgi:hypothetical protein
MDLPRTPQVTEVVIRSTTFQYGTGQTSKIEISRSYTKIGGYDGRMLSETIA